MPQMMLEDDACQAAAMQQARWGWGPSHSLVSRSWLQPNFLVGPPATAAHDMVACCLHVTV